MLLTLLDGTTVFVRPISPEDKPLLAEGLRRLSPETAFRRFLTPEGVLQRGRAALPDRGRPARPHRVRGAAGRRRSSRSPAACAPTTDTADLAIVVGDPWQGLGLGRQLVALVAERAREQGMTRIAGTMLAGNRRRCG